MSGKLKALVLTIAAVLQLSLVVGVGAGIANAAVGTAGDRQLNAVVGPADDRQMTTPTSWWTYSGVTGAQVGSLLSAHDARLTDIQVVDPTVPTFTVVMVANTGAYGSGWWWYYNATAAQVGSALSANHARLISAQAYNTGSGIRFAVVMVPNSGANQKGWWWYYGASGAQIAAALSANHARLIGLSPYPGGGFLALMVDNTGSNATGWWWYYGASGAQIGAALSANHARLIDLSINSNGTFNAVMYANSGTRWYWGYGVSLGAAVNQALQLGERIIDVIRYGNSYAVIETRNTNALEEKLWNIIGPTVGSGAYGFYLKQVSGPVLAGLQDTLQYEPASALKVLYHAWSIHEESLGVTHDSNTITYDYNPADPTNAGICPDNYSSTKTTNLITADEQMMWNSDNRMTKGLLYFYGGGTFAGGKSVMQSYAATLGLTSTQINHNIGCPTPTTHNRTTLSDLGKVYEAFETGKITTNSSWKSQFISRMLNQSNYSGFKNGICPIVNQEAAKLGKSAAVATSFCNAMTWIAKGGSYQYGGSFPYQVSWDGLSMTGIPFRSGTGSIAPKYFIFGEFVDGTTIYSTSQANNINAARGKEYDEAMRPYIDAALATW